MSDLTLTKICMSDGVWQGRIQGAGATDEPPDIRVSYLDQPVQDVSLTRAAEAGQWDLSIPIPAKAVAEGVQTFVIRDGASDTKLGDFTLIAGDAVADDLRTEVELLRAELDMLKRAFRRHCLNTM